MTRARTDAWPRTDATTATAAAIDAAYRRHADEIYRVALRYAGGDRGFAEDVVQDVFVNLCRTIDRLHDPDDLGGWLYRATCNRCLSKLRRRALELAPGVRWLLGQKHQATPSVDTIVGGRRDIARAFAAIGELPAKQQLAFCMFHLDGRRVHEIGEILGHSKGYVSKLITRATERLRRLGWEIDDV